MGHVSPMPPVGQPDPNFNIWELPATFLSPTPVMTVQSLNLPLPEPTSYVLGTGTKLLCNLIGGTLNQGLPSAFRMYQNFLLLLRHCDLNLGCFGPLPCKSGFDTSKNVKAAFEQKAELLSNCMSSKHRDPSEQGLRFFLWRSLGYLKLVLFSSDSMLSCKPFLT